MNFAARVLLAAWSCAVPGATMLAPLPARETASHQSMTDVGRLAEGAVRDNGAREIVDARLPPYAAVGRVKGTMVCTAAIILHPRIALTAAHCVTSASGKITPLQLFFQPGYQAGSDLGRFKAMVWAIGAQQDFAGQSVRDASNDWAILLLEQAPIDIRPLLLSKQSTNLLRRLGRKILMPSYSIDVAAAEVLSLDPTCSIRKRAWNVLLHDCKTSSGGSGAPLLIREQEWYAVVGIHSGSILERDEELHTMKVIGNEAIGAWTFADAIQALDRRLQSGGDLAISGPLAH